MCSWFFCALVTRFSNLIYCFCIFPEYCTQATCASTYTVSCCTVKAAFPTNDAYLDSPNDPRNCITFRSQSQKQSSHVLRAGKPQISYYKIVRSTRPRHVHRWQFKTFPGGKRQDSSVDVTAALHEHQTKQKLWFDNSQSSKQSILWPLSNASRGHKNV